MPFKSFLGISKPSQVKYIILLEELEVSRLEVYGKETESEHNATTRL